MVAQFPSPVDSAITALGKTTGDVSVFAVFRGGWCSVCGVWFEDWVAIPNISERLGSLNATLFLISRDTQNSADEAAKIRGFKDGTPNVVVVGDSELKWKSALQDHLGISLNTYYDAASDTETSMAPALQPACIVTQASKLLYSWKQKNTFLMEKVGFFSVADIYGSTKPRGRACAMFASNRIL